MSINLSQAMKDFYVKLFCINVIHMSLKCDVDNLPLVLFKSRLFFLFPLLISDILDNVTK